MNFYQLMPNIMRTLIRCGRYIKITIVLTLLTSLLSCSDEEVLYTYDDDSFVLYLTNNSSEGLIPIYIDYTPEKRDDHIIAIVNYLRNGISDNILASIPTEVELEEIEIYTEGIRLYFNEEYNKLDAVDELVVRSALVKTLTGVEGINEIEIYSDLKPIVDDKGNAIGTIYADDIMVDSENVVAYDKKTMTFYFANENGNYLEPVEYECSLYKNLSIEETILDILMKGLPNEGYESLVPYGTEIREIYIYEGVCYIDFNEEFVTNHLGGANSEMMTVYSIVNTLTELPDVTKVKFFIEGKSQEFYKGYIEFDGLFKRNLNIVEF